VVDVNLFKHILKEQLSESFNSQVELLSRDVALDFKYLNFRSLSGRIIGGKKSMSNGEFLLYEIIKEERKDIFPNRYDLGCREHLNKAQLKQKSLIEHLSKNEFESSSISNVEDIVKALKKVILELTGTEFKCFMGSAVDDSHPSYAIKTLCTLYRYRARWPKVFSRYQDPIPSKVNLEIRDAYPLKGFDTPPEDGVAIYSDLKLSLTHGMLLEQRKTLTIGLARVSTRYSTSVFFSPVKLLSDNINLVEELDIIKLNIKNHFVTGDKEVPDRLDCSCYVWLTLREVINKLKGKKCINEFLLTDEAKVSALHNFSRDSLIEIYEAMKNRDISIFRSLIKQTTNREFSEKEFIEAQILADKLYFIVKSPLGIDPGYNYLETLAALISCLGDDVASVKLKAYWYGKETTSNRPINYLEKIKGFDSLSATPEFYLEYWFRRFNLVLARLTETENIWQMVNEIEQFECESLIEMFDTHDFNSAIGLANSYFDKTPSIIE